MGAGGVWQAHRGRAELYRVEYLDVLYSTPPGGQWHAALGTTGTTTEPPYPHDPSSSHTVGVIRLQAGEGATAKRGNRTRYMFARQGLSV